MYKFKFLMLFTVLALMPAPQITAKPHREVKNIIFMIGDGMGVAQVTALMLENGNQPTNIQRAQAVGLVTTQSANNRVTDSAAAATALATGHKTDNSKIGVAPDGTVLTSILEKAEAAGMPTGVVVTCYLAHATPAAFYASSNSRYSSEDITAQLVESGVDVAFGGGKAMFDNRKDGRNLFDEARSKGYVVANNIDSVASVDRGKVIVAYSTRKHMPYMTEGRGDYLPKATAKALQILDNNARDKGFFVMIEGSLIDYAGHYKNPELLKAELRDFDKAVGVAMDYADRTPGTLVVVLADHETGGLSIVSNKEDFTKSESGLDYRYGTGGHSATMVPLFAYGAGASECSRIRDNTEVNKLMCRMLGLE